MNISLLPNKFKTIGWLILIPTSILGLVVIYTDYSVEWLNIKTFAILNKDFGQSTEMFTYLETNLTNTLLGSLIIIGGILVSFSKEKIEDEYISSLRLSSLMWAVLLNYLILLLSFLFIYGLSFLDIMVYNMFTVLIIFILRFHYLIYKNSKNTL
jgi:hypothetical protein